MGNKKLASSQGAARITGDGATKAATEKELRELLKQRSELVESRARASREYHEAMQDAVANPEKAAQKARQDEKQRQEDINKQQETIRLVTAVLKKKPRKGGGFSEL